jgi:hypothetical protein
MELFGVIVFFILRQGVGVETTRPRHALELDRERGYLDNVAERGVIWHEVFQRLPAFLSMTDALPLGRILLLPPLIQLSLHGLQGVPDVLLRCRRGLRGDRWCWSNRHMDDLLLWHHAGDLTLEQSEIPLIFPDVEVDSVRSGMRWRHVLLLGQLRLR